MGLLEGALLRIVPMEHLIVPLLGEKPSAGVLIFSFSGDVKHHPWKTICFWWVENFVPGAVT